ncbi:hypothetical protein [Kitasatospora sp. NPDC057198]|uniref:hypothetical protein n=1 Tax=Kitasatospora sp. NPDC057198 TaxID=3346046 RepID=UPI0036360BCC
MTRNGAAHHYLTDAQDSMTTVVDNTGQQVNAYTGGDPVNHTDPNGLWSIGDTINTVLSGVGLVAAIPTGGASLTLLGAVGPAAAQTALVWSVACGFSENC